MSTLYDLFKVKEDASLDEIKESYEKIIEKANSLPENDKITEKVRRIKIAYGILSDNEKRKQYDIDLAKKRAEELLEKIEVKQESAENEEKIEEQKIVEEGNIKNIDEQRLRKAIEQEIDNVIQAQNANQSIRNEEALKEEKILRKMQKKQERKNKKLAKREAEYLKEKRMYAYGEYLSKQGYKVKYPWTWRRIKRVMTAVFVTLIVLIIAWHIPAIQRPLKNLYDNNFVVKFFIDIIISILLYLKNLIKGIFIH